MSPPTMHNFAFHFSDRDGNKTGMHHGLNLPETLIAMACIGVLIGVSYGFLPAWLPPKMRKAIMNIAALILNVNRFGPFTRRWTPKQVKFVRRNTGYCLVIIVTSLIVLLAMNGWKI